MITNAQSTVKTISRQMKSSNLKKKADSLFEVYVTLRLKKKDFQTNEDE